MSPSSAVTQYMLASQATIVHYNTADSLQLTRQPTLAPYSSLDANATKDNVPAIHLLHFYDHPPVSCSPYTQQHPALCSSLKANAMQHNDPAIHLLHWTINLQCSCSAHTQQQPKVITWQDRQLHVAPLGAHRVLGARNGLRAHHLHRLQPPVRQPAEDAVHALPDPIGGSKHWIGLAVICEARLPRLQHSPCVLPAFGENTVTNSLAGFSGIKPDWVQEEVAGWRMD